MAETEQYSSFRGFTLFQQQFQTLQSRDHLRFHILRTPAVDIAVLYYSAKGIDLPAFAVGGNYVLVSQNRRGQQAVVAAFYLIYYGILIDLDLFRVGHYQRESCFQIALIFVKNAAVRIVIGQSHRFYTHGAGEFFGDLSQIYFGGNVFRGSQIRFFRRNSPDDHYRYKSHDNT